MKGLFKRATALALIGIMVLCLAACGKKEEPEIEGERIDSTAFSVICPEGWTNLPQYITNVEVKEGEDYPLNPKSIQFCKEAETAIDVYTKPSIAFTKLNGKDVDEILFQLGGYYEKFEEETFTINGTECKGAHCSNKGIMYGFDYQYVYVEVDDVLFQICLVYGLDTIGDSGLRITDEDIQAVIASIKLD